MSEQPAPEQILPSETLLSMATSLYGEAPDVQPHLGNFVPRMQEEELVQAVTGMHDVFTQHEQQANAPSTVQEQVSRQIGAMLYTVYGLYKGEVVLPVLLEELNDAITVAEQTSDAGYTSFDAVVQQLTRFKKEIQQRQWRG